MSWIIGEYIRQLSYIKEAANIDSDEYNNAIIIEKVMKDMLESGLINQMENDVIWAVSAGYSYSEISRMLGIHRLTASDIFKKVTDRISYILGGEFTDSAFIERIQTVENIKEDNLTALIRRGIVETKNSE